MRAAVFLLILLGCVLSTHGALQQRATFATAPESVGTDAPAPTPPPMRQDSTALTLTVSTGTLTGTLSAAATLSPPPTVDPVVVPLTGSVTCDSDLTVEKSGLQVDGDMSLAKDSMLQVPRLTFSSTARIMVTSTPRIRTGFARPVQMAPVM